MILLIDNIIEDLVRKVANNTEPLDLFEYNLGWWSFAIATIGVILSSIAARYGYLGYKYQKRSAKSLAAMSPGHMSYFSIAQQLLNNYFDFKTLMKSDGILHNHVVKMHIGTSKMPDDLIDMKRYEKNKQCYNLAFNCLIRWRRYNTEIDTLINLYSESNEKSQLSNSIRYLANSSLTEAFNALYIEKNLVEHKLIDGPYHKVISLAYPIMDTFFSEMESLRYTYDDDKDLSIFLSDYLTIENEEFLGVLGYLFYEDKFSFGDYIKDDKNRLNILSISRGECYKKLCKGEYDIVKYYLYKKSKFRDNEFPIPFSSLVFKDFKKAYIYYIEPLILSKRYLLLTSIYS